MPPAMQVLDASSREYCTVRETRTNTPLQALNLMNDTTYVEAARLMALRMMMEGGKQAEDRLAFGLRLAAGRRPDDVEKRVLLDNLQTQLEFFRAHPQQAEQLLAVGAKHYDTKLKADELAAYAVVASLILNLDEVITKQ
jgi:hypothetical protein